MYKDILIFLPEHEEKAKKIVDIFLEQTVSKNYTGILNICGISGSAKTEIARLVETELYKKGISSHVISLDRFYKVPADKREEWRKKHNYAGSEEIDWIRVDQETKRWEENNIQVLCFEGLFAGLIDGITFYLESSVEESEDFRKLRGKEPEHTKHRQWVVGMEYSDILKNKRFYDYTI